MGKNQAYKAMQRSRLGASSAGVEEIEDGMVDGSFHSPEWHAARLAGLKTSHTVTWEEFKKKQKEDALRKGELEADTDRMMREYRAQLDAERASKLAHGRNHSRSKSSHKKDRKKKDAKKRSSKKRKRSRRRSSDSSSSSSSSESSSSEDEERESRKSKSKSRREKKKKHKSRNRNSSTDNEDGEGPVPLSRFFGSVKS
ncbi:Mitogen-activated protein kinase 6 [Hibiscus syriacus]|uniref:Mitogen-activated protein kinase 6 n=1 Tax=Hibiscus syriacus TaxID=106335 RepID=A0A6A3CD19_HIBSY|nr:protein FAM133-like [Hibiscus syriacus]KAE8726686.1 Mitogen-activated protein kinase 6 [Hibiscus syriacus]